MKKRKLAVLFLLCTLLAGCSAQHPGSPQPRLSPTKQTETDNLRRDPLDAANCRFFTFEGDLLMIQSGKGGEALSLYRGKHLIPGGEVSVPTGAVPCKGDSIACFDPAGQTLLVFSRELALEHRYSLPGCTGTPCLAGERIYYCTAGSLMELDTRTMLHRTLRQQEGLTLSLVLPEESMAVCGTEIFRLEDGALVQTAPPILEATAFGTRQRLCLQLGENHCLYLGSGEIPLPPGWRFRGFVPNRNQVLTQQPGQLAIYDLATCNRVAALPLDNDLMPEALCMTADGRVFFRSGSMLCQWEPEQQPTQDGGLSLVSPATAQAPDQAGLAQCRQRAAFLENRYGIRVLLNTDALEAAPAGCQLEPEHLRRYILEVLSALETALGKFPDAMVKAACGGPGRTYLCPVRSIVADGESRAQLLCRKGQDCYLLLTPSAQAEQAALELFAPLVERQLLLNCDALDGWQEEPLPTETLLLAIQQGNRELFLDAVLQSRLRALCLGIRRVFAIQTDTLLWEQYLWNPIS